MNYIRFLIDNDLKVRFIKACDGRSMTKVLIFLITKYILDCERSSKDE